MSAKVTVTIEGEALERLNAHVARISREHGRYSRADAVRAAVRHYLDLVAPVPETVEGSAVEISALELPSGEDGP